MAGPYRYVIGPVVERTVDAMTFYAPPESCVSWIDLRRRSEMASLGQVGCGFFTMPSGWSIPSGYHWLAENQGPGDCRSLYLTARDQAAWLSLLGANPTRTASTTLIDALDETLTTLADPTGESGPVPLVPESGEGPPAVAHIVLAGHSIVRRKELAIGGNWWKKLVALHQRELDDAATRDSSDKLWRKRLGDLSRKYFGAHDDVRGNQLVSQRLKRDRAPSNPDARQADRIFARKPETSYTESFNGSDSSTLGVDLTWSEIAESWSNVSNAGQFDGNGTATDGFARAEHDVSSADHYAQTTLAVRDTGFAFQSMGVACRFASSVTTAYVSVVDFFDGRKLWKFLSGTVTELAASGTATSFPCAFRVTASGSTISAKHDATQYASVTDTSISGNTRGGLYAFWGSASMVYPQFGDWIIADLTTPYYGFRNLCLTGAG